MLLNDKRVLISAGPMRTALDAVRYVQNRSSGQMGLAVARAAKRAGAKVSVLLGPVESAIAREFEEFKVTRYVGPAEYADSLEKLFGVNDIFLSLAAVLDFELIAPDHKLEREQLAAAGALNIPLKPVPDFVARMAQRKRADQTVIAFAAESGTDAEIQARAERKMRKKTVQAIVANPVRAGLGPDATRNELWVIFPDRPPVHLGPAEKSALAEPLLKALFPG